MLGKIDWQPKPAKVRYFALTLLIGFLLLATLLLFLDKQKAAIDISLIGLGLATLSYLLPPVGKIIYLFWMVATFAIGTITTPVVAAIIFYLLLTPIALAFRLAGRDLLQIKKPAGKETYFTEHNRVIDKDSFTRQF